MMPSCSATAPCLPSSSGRCCLIQHLILLDQANVPIRKAPTSKPCSSRSRKATNTVANCAPSWSNIPCSCWNWASVPCSTAICPTALTCSAPCEVERWLREKQRTLDHHHLQDLFHATVHALQEEIPGLGEVVAIDVKHQYAWVRENNLRESIKDRFCKERQPRGDPDCRVGVKSSTNQEQPDGSTKERKEYLWGSGSGIATATTPDYGDIVIADFTQGFNESDVSYFLRVYIQTVAVLGFFPLHITADAAYDARSRLPDLCPPRRHHGHSQEWARTRGRAARSRWRAVLSHWLTHASHLPLLAHQRLSRSSLSLSLAVPSTDGRDLRARTIPERQRLCQGHQYRERGPDACHA